MASDRTVLLALAQTLTNKTLTSPVVTTPTITSPVINTGVSGTAILDEDDMATDSATQLATQQSIKAFVTSGGVTMTNKRLTAPKLNEDVSVSATATEVNILDGVTANTAEINILDGVTATTAEINSVCDGVPNTSAETDLSITVGTSGATLATYDVGAVNDGDIFLCHLVIQGGTKGGTAGRNQIYLQPHSSSTCTIKASLPNTYYDFQEIPISGPYYATVSGVFEIATDGNFVLEYYGYSVGSTTTGVTAYFVATQLKNAA